MTDARITELEAAQPYREVWSDEVPPGGIVCSICGIPVESEPCPQHAPAAPIGWALVITSERGTRYLVTHVGGVLDRAAAEGQAAYWRDELGEPTARVVELREVTE